MGTAERRAEIMKMLCRRRSETISNLAYEFGVSQRTIRRDIEVLSLTEPIYTKTGRYEGGVYVVEGYYKDRMYVSDSEAEVLKKLYEFAEKEQECRLTIQELNIFRNLITNYIKPVCQKERQVR